MLTTLTGVTVFHVLQWNTFVFLIAVKCKLAKTHHTCLYAFLSPQTDGLTGAFFHFRNSSVSVTVAVAAAVIALMHTHTHTHTSSSHTHTHTYAQTRTDTRTHPLLIF